MVMTRARSPSTASKLPIRSSSPNSGFDVLLNTRAGLMPADDKPRLSPAEQATLERWIKRDVFHIDPKNPDPGRVTVRRLNRVEYRNTVQRPARRRLQHRPRIPARRHGLRLRQHRRRAHHLAHAHGEVRRGRADHHRGHRAAGGAQAARERGAPVSISPARTRAPSGASASSSSPSPRTSRPRSRTNCPAVIACSSICR